MSHSRLEQRSVVRFFISAIAIAAVGGGVIYLGIAFPEMRSFLWPFDGATAIVGGIGLFAWAVLRLSRSV